MPGLGLFCRMGLVCLLSGGSAVKSRLHLDRANNRCYDTETTLKKFAILKERIRVQTAG